MALVDVFVVGLVSFLRNTIGIVVRPYETFRRISYEPNPWELPGILGMLALYFAISSVVKTAAFRPFLLTKQFIVLGSAVGMTYVFMTGLLWYVSRAIGGRGTFRTLSILWAYTLIPTVLWFLATSILYVLIPPPRTTGALGIVFSILFLVFSTSLFFWKFMLSYLTLRFGMKLDFARIAVIAAIVIPVVGIYSVCMYKLGIFRVPFI